MPSSRWWRRRAPRCSSSPCLVALSPAAEWPRRVLASIGPLALGLAAAVATVATLGSLYYSEVADFPPCRLCWYQRIAMYPLVPILAIAAVRRDRAVRWYALPLVVIGAAISVWHGLVERFPSLESGACDPLNPCSIVWVEKFGYLTIPAWPCRASSSSACSSHSPGDPMTSTSAHRTPPRPPTPLPPPVAGGDRPGRRGPRRARRPARRGRGEGTTTTRRRPATGTAATTGTVVASGTPLPQLTDSADDPARA